MYVGYIRASIDEVDKSNQKKKIEEYANKEGFVCSFVEDTVSSTKDFEKRKISTLINQSVEGDSIIVAELSRLARNTEETLMIARVCLEKKIKLIVLNPLLTFDDAIMTKAIITIMGLSAEIERYYIQSRTKIALQKRKEEIKSKGYFVTKKGIKRYHLGSIRGEPKKLKLENKKDEIFKLLDKGINKVSICKLVGCSRPTLDKFLERNPWTKSLFSK